MARKKAESSSPPRGVVTVMFTDIVDSTRLKAMMEGETSSRRDKQFIDNVKKPHDQLLLSLAKEAGGHKANSTGDGYCFTFTDVEEAVLCALRIQERLEAEPVTTPLGPLRLRIGLHTGMASPEAGDYIATTMDKAARVQAQAEAGQVFISRETHVLLQGKLQGVTFLRAGSFELKGLAAEELFQVRRAAASSTGKSDSGSWIDFQNPFEFDATATRKTFKGRELEIGELLDSIESGTHTAVFGLQRVGKTSLIEEGLKEGLKTRPELARSVLPVKIDLQGLGGDQVKYRDLVHAIIEAVTEKLTGLGIGRAVNDLRGLTHELFAAGRFQRGDRTQFFAMFARLLRGFAAAAHRRIVLVIDEFSEVRKVIERNKIASQHNPLRTSNLLPHDMYLDVAFIHHLSSALKDWETKKAFTLIVLVRPFMAEYDERESLQILKLMKPIMLYYLDEAAARALIVEPLQGLVSHQPEAIDYLHQLTAGHPYVLQFMLKMIVDRIRREKRRAITLEDVQAIENRMISEGPAYDAQFTVLISDYSIAEIMHPKEALLGKGALALIAQTGNDRPEAWVPEELIFNGLKAHNVPPEKTASLLSQLTRTKIVDETNQNGQLLYRIAIPLLRKRFVKQNLYLKYFR